MAITAEELVRRNARFAAGGAFAALPFPSAQTLRVIGCVDSRVDPSHVLDHTDCGIKRLADPPGMLAEFFEIPVADLDAKAVNDPYAAVRVDVDVARRTFATRFLVSGLVYDTDTGLIEIVVPPAAG